jgi:hypothetical protein
VDSGRWEVCEDAGFQGRCVVLRRGSYDTLQRMGIDNRISSVRPVQGNRRDAAAMPEPLAAPDYAYRRRPNERVVEVPVTSVRAVVGPPSERCWVERQQVTEPVRNPPNKHHAGLLGRGLQLPGPGAACADGYAAGRHHCHQWQWAAQAIGPALKIESCPPRCGHGSVVGRE